MTRRTARRRCKKPVTDKGRLQSQKFISDYHRINERISSAGSDENILPDEKEKIISSLVGQQLEMGGLATYQIASKKGARGFDTSKWLISQLGRLGLFGEKKRLLDVGAVSTPYQRYKKWVDWEAIDLYSTSPLIRRCDFLNDRSVPPLPRYSVCCLSLTLNFVGCPKKRWQMIKKAKSVLREEGSFLYIVLPKHCLSNSGKMTLGSFLGIMDRQLGLRLAAFHSSPKLVFLLLTVDCIAPVAAELRFDRSKGRNSFEISAGDCPG